MATDKRRSQHLLIIGPGFGREVNPRQARMLQDAGFQITWVNDVPNPEIHGVDKMAHIPTVQRAIEDCMPDCVAAASKGAAYLTLLWELEWWDGPSLMINCHPTLTEIPENVTFVLAHGSNDEVYPTPRAHIESIMQTGSSNSCFMYHTANSGQLQTGQITRPGDKHNMETLLYHDCLPRLFDAVMCGGDPEMHMLRSWNDRLHPARLRAEGELGYAPSQLKRFWVSSGRKGDEDQKLFPVQRGTNEWNSIMDVLFTPPVEQAAYCGTNYEAWQRREIISVLRVENGKQVEGSFKPYHESLKRNIQDQGLSFEPGVHTRWGFHGTDAIDSIVSNSVSGFQPLASGTRGASLWGSGTYFARDAKYVAEGGFAKPLHDGSRRMLMCLMAPGVPCLGDPNHHGVLPFRQASDRYNSSVDSLSNPEIFILQHPGAAYPAYLINFV